MSSWTDIVSAIAAGGATGTGAMALVHRLAKRALVTLAADIADAAAVKANIPLETRVDTVEASMKTLDGKVVQVGRDVTDLRVSLATQFGGNGGGMREAINKLQVDLAEVKGHLSATSIPVLDGKHEAKPSPEGSAS